jgi:enolase
MVSRINSVNAMEILDSCVTRQYVVLFLLKNNIFASASVPSGASTGENEAVELRDGEKKRYGGKGVLKAVRNVNEVIAPHLTGMEPSNQVKIDRMLIDLDGTPNKANLGPMRFLAFLWLLHAPLRHRQVCHFISISEALVHSGFPCQ